MTEDDIRYMRLALSLGRRGLGQCWPNPAVGCVIVKDDVVLGRGWTQPGGRPHAETEALGQAGSAAKGATAYVSLEPCAHQGATPPCSQALIKAGIARVVSPFLDEDPRVSGAGFAQLRAAGVEVVTGVLAEEAAMDHAGFLMRLRENRPWVTLKLASSFDGRIATASGHSQWITGPQARHEVHGYRARHDAVMVGAGTARADDPMLTVRGYGARRQPVRVVVSRKLDIPTDSSLARTAKEVPVWLCHGYDAPSERVQTWTDLGAICLPCDLQGQTLDLRAALQVLAEQGLTRVFSEGGGGLAASLLAQDLVDELIGYTAGLAIGAEGLPALGAMGIPTLDEAQRFKRVEIRAVGDDVLHRWRRH